MKQTISVLVENQAGVLNRITGLFSRRAFNIESLAVGVTDDPTISRITIIVDSGNSVVEQVEKQLNKLIEVIKVRTLEENSLIGRELMILKVNANNKTRQDIMTICEIMGAKVDDISPTSLTLEPVSYTHLDSGPVWVSRRKRAEMAAVLALPPIDAPTPVCYNGCLLYTSM